MTLKIPASMGFSLVELVAMIAIIGILAAFAIPRFASVTSFESRGFYDQAEAVVRYAQKIAIASRAGNPQNTQPLVFVVISTNQIQVCYSNATCATPVLNPSTGAALVVTAPNNVTLSPATNFSYNALGVPSAGATINVNSSGVGDINRSFAVDATTGYVSP